MEFLQKRLNEFIASYLTRRVSFYYALEHKQNYTHTHIFALGKTEVGVW